MEKQQSAKELQFEMIKLSQTFSFDTVFERRWKVDLTYNEFRRSFLGLKLNRRKRKFQNVFPSRRRSYYLEINVFFLMKMKEKQFFSFR